MTYGEKEVREIIIKRFLASHPSEITASDYQQISRNTRNEDLDFEDQIINATLGIAGEAGEVSDTIKKDIYHGHIRNDIETAEELGDLLFYIAWMADVLGYDLGSIMQQNVNKLQGKEGRYEDGFSKEASISRKR